MSHSVKRSTIANILLLSTVIQLIACSSKHLYKIEINDNESYLQSSRLRNLNTPSGMILPVEHDDYDVPYATTSGKIGIQLDISPPVQPLVIIKDSKVQSNGNAGRIILGNECSLMWADVTQLFHSYNFPILDLNNKEQRLTTDWISWWNYHQKNNKYNGRYQVSMQLLGDQRALAVRLIELQQNGKVITSPVLIARYTIQILNEISAGLDKVDIANRNMAEGRTPGHIDVQNRMDKANLPILVLRAPFNIVWKRLPQAMKLIGMEVTKSNFSHGIMHITYKSPGSSVWKDFGTKNPHLLNGNYKIHISDLDNRSSLQFVDSKNHVITSAQNSALGAVFQVVLNK
ncbi:outer membrane protein assembly factor BamC [Pantoea sp. Nvir]|uniref:outer membrane protein assembly factor BamC n=1 Tax=Pantoea sp. Nvir TaxID=2576760 RepID=UPI001357F084|nr:outer membrane protein assembly factor BamC [Pantoea sp. Nvir]MXP66568.1 outer membrane protein assembly factor BamC [Pantoea sp. Nvir]CAJ0992192.1 Outer membrane protein assembly factor BamC [Pantoea sp. Nvir]